MLCPKHFIVSGYYIMSNKNNHDLLGSPGVKHLTVTPITNKDTPKSLINILYAEDKKYKDKELDQMEKGVLDKSYLTDSKKPFFDGIGDKERSLITNNDKQNAGSLKRKKRLSCKNKKRITRKMRKSSRNKKPK